MKEDNFMKRSESSSNFFVIFSLSSFLLVGCNAGSDTRSRGQLAVEEAGSSLQGTGLCATLRQLEEDCPYDLDWDNHGQYVSCVAKYFAAREEQDDASDDDYGEFVSEAARSPIGMPKAALERGPHGQGGAGGAAPGAELVSPFEDAIEAACGAES